MDIQPGPHKAGQTGVRAGGGAAGIHVLGHFPVERMDRFRTERGGQLAGGGDVEVSRFLDGELGLEPFVFTPVEMTLKPAIGGLAARLRPAVRVVILEEIDLVPGVEKIEQPRRFLVGRARPCLLYTSDAADE